MGRVICGICKYQGIDSNAYLLRNPEYYDTYDRRMVILKNGTEVLLQCGSLNLYTCNTGHVTPIIIKVEQDQDMVDEFKTLKLL